ncbi:MULTISPECIES: phage baseplate assembly protein V [unclassified Borrelia]|uniref:phage baseplate assembly protein V n=1 Tax=unclassified Borrelia TaxID=2649934 RepID=UPI001E2A40BA|nr:MULTISPECIES: phage baseplate assembly protein V [unclassified Borrelia]UGQ16693.1 phage baseplate assembly protein V [Borrelia sp. RT5S]UGQ17851.1 phage baseplate assembly protein V [Borrelia sp. RT1S]
MDGFKIIELCKRYLPSNLVGVVVQINENSLAVEVELEGHAITLPAVRMIAGREFDYVPEVGSEVVIAFLNNKFDQPFVIGALSGVGRKKESVSGDKVSLDAGERKVAIRNDNASTKLILEKINKNVNTLRDEIRTGLDVSVTLTGTAVVGAATMAVTAPVRGTASKNINIDTYPDKAIEDLFKD